MWRLGFILFAFSYLQIEAKISEEETNDSADVDLDESSEHLGPTVTQIIQHPYSASLLKNNSYICSAIILNTYWLLTSSKCFDSNVISLYVTYKNLADFTVRVGSSYNNKGGSLYKIQQLINNFDMKVSCVKVETGLIFGSRINSVRLPSPDDDVALGYLASIIAWTPTGHIRSVNAPVIESSLCESFTKMLPGHYICVGGVQDPDRHFCRRDNGGAVVQNSTLIGISAFVHSCALYTKTHAFPKISSFARWIDSVIWDEDNRPTTASTTTNTQPIPNVTETTQQNTIFADPRKFMLTLPFDPVNVPLEPAEDNSVIPRMSLYESYLQNLAKVKTSTTANPKEMEQAKREWLKHFGSSIMMMPQQINEGKYDTNDYN